MLALTTPLKLRLQALPALTGWAVRTGTDAGDRRAVPAVDVRCTAAAVRDSRTGRVTVVPEWLITLIVRRSDTAADQLDAAFAAVLGSVHDWMPGPQGGRNWEPLQLARVSEPMLAEEGVAGYELAFSTATVYAVSN